MYAGKGRAASVHAPREDGPERRAPRTQGTLIPSHLTRQEFGKVSVQDRGQEVLVEFIVWLPDDREGWKTGLALDASTGMAGWYGRQTVGEIPDSAMEEYIRRGWASDRTGVRGCEHILTDEAITDARARGYIRPMPNIVEPVAREMLGYLAGELDADGRTALIYWACGDGRAMEHVGDFTKDDCRTLDVSGPHDEAFGDRFYLLPALKYFAERFDDARIGIYVFVISGPIDDFEAVKAYTGCLARSIRTGNRNPVRCVLIGVGPLIDEDQMKELDGFETGTDVDIWDCLLHKNMRGIEEILVGSISPDRIAAPTGTVHDAEGNVVARFTDGMPARVSFTMPATSSHFVLEAGGKRIEQTVVSVEQ